MTKIKAVIFDMDGVLIDAKEWHYESLNRALSFFGYEISEYDHLVTFDGLPTKDKLKMLTSAKGLPIELHQFINEMKQIYTAELIFTRCKPKFNHQRALSQLKADGYKIAVCSNSIKSTIQMMMDKADLLKYLDFFLSNEDVSRAKPDPEIYNKAIKMLNLSPEECLICEDNFNGIEAAKASRANLLEIKNTIDVNYENITSTIKRFETGN